MVTTSQPRLAWFVELVEEYRQARPIATIVQDASDGEPARISERPPNSGTKSSLSGLEVTAYFNGSPGLTASGIWVPQVRYDGGSR